LMVGFDSDAGRWESDVTLAGRACTDDAAPATRLLRLFEWSSSWLVLLFHTLYEV
jgi:hypothetical protein